MIMIYDVVQQNNVCEIDELLLDCAHCVELCGRSSIMCKIIHVHNRIILLSLSEMNLLNANISNC